MLLLACTARLVVFGDSNLGDGWDSRNHLVNASYISTGKEPGPHLIDEKIARYTSLCVVNHALSGRATGGVSPKVSSVNNARAIYGGLTTFEAEVMGIGGSAWTFRGKTRSQAFQPTANDYVLVSLGTNDAKRGMGADSTIADLRWMVDKWQAAGLPASHFILTTLAPRTDGNGQEIPRINPRIRQLAIEKGLGLIDLAAYSSPDDGVTWRSRLMHVGDGVHYTEPVRDWLARSVAEIIREPQRQRASR